MCFADLHRDPNQGTLLLAGFLKEIADNMKLLSKHETIVTFSDFKNEIFLMRLLSHAPLFVTFQVRHTQGDAHS